MPTLDWIGNDKVARCQPVDLRTEHRRNPIGLGETVPRLSWRMEDSRRGAHQTAWRIVAASAPALLDAKPDLWDSGRIRGGDCIGIAWRGAKLRSRQRVFWRVRIWDAAGDVSDWSETASFEMGLLRKADWRAKWIGRPTEPGRPCPHLRRTFTLRGGIARARAYVTARGVFELHLNGRRVGCDRFAPGWTDYRRRIQVSTYDIAEQLQEGENVVGAILGDGWYAGRIRGLGRRFWYGEQLSLLVQIEVEHADGARTLIAGDEAWKTSTGPILSADFYDGEAYDARLEMAGWSAAGCDDSAWAPAVVLSPPLAALTPSLSAPIRPQETLKARTLAEPRPGAFVFDLGQNMTGLARIRLRQPRGREIVVRYAEMLKADGTLYTENLRTAKCTDRYLCRGGGEEAFEPHFTFHGFRYVELTGLDGRPERGDVVGVVLHSDMERTGDFVCSDERINRLYACIVWGQKGNFLDIPTDCPQRDERLGWTGDAQVFANTACLNYDAAAFFAKWCVDVDDAQRSDGAFTNTAPDVYDGAGGEAAWGDAGVICPWAAYRFSGDAAILERHYAAMAKWIRWRERNSPGLVHARAAWGDWLAIDASPDDLGRSPTPRDLIGTAYFAHTAAIVAKVARVLGRRADAVRFSKLATRIRAAFNREFVAPSGRIVGDSQTGYLLALGFDLLPKAKRGHALERLVEDLASRGWHLSTGFVGTPLLAPVLTRFGRGDVALRLLLQTTYPSWLYPVLQGATTMWERWNSFTLDQGFGSAGMNSFNHYAYGAVGEWLYGAVGGIELDPDEPGGRRVVFRPCVGGGLTWARCAWKSPRGLLSSAWRLEGGRLTLDIALPPNTRGTVMLPGRKPVEVGPGEHRFKARHKGFACRLRPLRVQWQAFVEAKRGTRSMITIAIMGAGGRMGTALVQAVKNFPNLKLAAAVEQPGHPMVGVDSGTVAGCPPTGVPVTDDPEAAVAAADVVIDFTFHAVVPAVAACVRRHRKAYVLGTTGLTPDELAAVEAAAQVVPVLMAPNMSLGVNLLLNLVKQAAAVLGAGYDAEIVEMHHRHKKDAPSGTAIALAKAVAAGRCVDFDAVACYGREGITGERAPETIAVHAVRGGDVVGDHVVMFAADGERVELAHKATGRGGLASGALRAAEWLATQRPGFHALRDMLGL